MCVIKKAEGSLSADGLGFRRRASWVKSALPDGNRPARPVVEPDEGAIQRSQEDQVRSTSNPAFRNLPSGGFGGRYAGFQPQAQGYPVEPGYGGYPAPPTTADRPMTVDDVVTKTAMTLGLALIVGVITAIAVLNGSVNPIPLVVVGGLVGFGLALVNIFKKVPSAGLVLAYSAAQGVFLGAITGVFEQHVKRGIGFQAILGTALVFIVMLIVYRTGAIKVTPKLTRWIIGATFAALGLVVVNLLLSLFGVNTHLRDAGPLGIGISLLFIGIAAFNFLLDFDMADQMIRSGTPSKYAWYVAFGLMVTLVWLYLEILRLLSYLNSESPTPRATGAWLTGPPGALLCARRRVPTSSRPCPHLRDGVLPVPGLGSLVDSGFRGVGAGAWGWGCGVLH
jgi:uncharacterized YccA/Bax inhibitor family protein